MNLFWRRTGFRGLTVAGVMLGVCLAIAEEPPRLKEPANAPPATVAPLDEPPPLPPPPPPPECVDWTVPVCRLKLVRKPVKKTIYWMKLVPYCPHGAPCPLDGDCCGECPKCAICPRFKRVLIKQEITIGEKCEWECVVEQEPACSSVSGMSRQLP